MRFINTVAALAQLSLVVALPHRAGDLSALMSRRDRDRAGERGAERGGAGRGAGRGDGAGAAPSPIIVPLEPSATPSAAAPPPAAETPAAGKEGEGEGKEGEEGEENEVEQEGKFDEAIVLPAGDKVDTLFPPGESGTFEIEFQGGADKTLTVSKNDKPAAAPAGFVHAEKNSFIVKVAEGPEGATLQKVDFIGKADGSVDLSKGTIGRFCSEANAFIIDPAIGEQEFEVEENELVLKPNDLNGEFAIFLPDPAGAAPAAPPAEGAAPPAEGAAGNEAKAQELARLLLELVNGAGKA